MNLVHTHGCKHTRLENLVCCFESSLVSRFETTIAIEEAFATVFCNILSFARYFMKRLNVNLKGGGRIGGGLRKT